MIFFFCFKKGFNSSKLKLLLFPLISQNRKGRDAGDELIVAEGFKPGGRDRGRAEGKGQRQSEMRVPFFCVMKVADLERSGA